MEQKEQELLKLREDLDGSIQSRHWNTLRLPGRSNAGTSSCTVSYSANSPKLNGLISAKDQQLGETGLRDCAAYKTLIGECHTQRHYATLQRDSVLSFRPNRGINSPTDH